MRMCFRFCFVDGMCEALSLIARIELLLWSWAIRSASTEGFLRLRWVTLGWPTHGVAT